MSIQLMEIDEIKNNVSKKVMEILQISVSISEDEDLTTRGLDSMKTVELVVELEEMFDIIFDDEEMLTENFTTIGKIVNRLQTKR